MNQSTSEYIEFLRGQRRSDVVEAAERQALHVITDLRQAHSIAARRMDARQWLARFDYRRTVHSVATIIRVLRVAQS